MTYLVSYYLHAFTHNQPFARAFQKRGSFIVDADTCEAAETKARTVLRDAVDYGVRHLRYPEHTNIRLGSILPTTPKEPEWEDVLQASAGEVESARDHAARLRRWAEEIEAATKTGGEEMSETDNTTTTLPLYLFDVAIDNGWFDREIPLCRSGYVGTNHVTAIHEDINGAMQKAVEHLREQDSKNAPISAEWRALHEWRHRIHEVKCIARVDVP